VIKDIVDNSFYIKIHKILHIM